MPNPEYMPGWRVGLWADIASWLRLTNLPLSGSQKVESTHQPPKELAAHFQHCSTVKRCLISSSTQRDASCLGGLFQHRHRGWALLDLILTDKEKLTGGVQVRSSLGCGDHVMLELSSLRERNKARSRITALDVGRADFAFSGICLEESPGTGPW